MSKWCANCIILRLERENEPEGWKQLHVGGIVGIRWQHLQEWCSCCRNNGSGRRTGGKDVWHGSEMGPTMYLASMEIKTVFDVARPKHFSQNMVDQEVHGWVTAALLREMVGLEGQASFAHVHSSVRRALKLSSCGSELQCRSCGLCRKNERGKRCEFILAHVMVNITRSAVLRGRTTTGSCLTHRRTWSRS